MNYNKAFALLSTFFIVLSSNCVQSFVARPGINTPSSSKLLLRVSIPLMTEEEANYRMQKARECALSDTCSVDEANEFLHEVLHVQGSCVSGTLAGQDLCEGNQDVVAETVALLRKKSQAETSHLPSMLGVSQVTNNPMTTGPLAIVLFCSATIIISTIDTNPDTTPFTFQEWYWAMKDGYLDQMISHYFRNGGL